MCLCVRQTERERERDTHTHTDKERDRQRERESERERERERERETHVLAGGFNAAQRQAAVILQCAASARICTGSQARTAATSTTIPSPPATENIFFLHGFLEIFFRARHTAVRMH